MASGSAREHEHCAACGFDGAAYDNATLVTAVRDLGPRWVAVLAGAGAELRRRPEPEVWSAIEYAAHSRDITALHEYGVQQALTGTEPVLPAIADDLIQTAAIGYGDADPSAVGAELSAHAEALAALAAGAEPDGWRHGLTVGDSRLDVRWLLEHALHDSVHHLRDVDLGLAKLRGH